MASVLHHGGVHPVVVPALEGATQTFKKGDLVQWNGGYVKIGSTTQVCGIALKDASGTTGAALDIELIDPLGLYRMYNSGTIAIADIGKGTTITYTVGAHTFAVAAADTTPAHVVGLIDAVGSAGGWEIVRFNPTYVLSTLYFAA